MLFFTASLGPPVIPTMLKPAVVERRVSREAQRLARNLGTHTQVLSLLRFLRQREVDQQAQKKHEQSSKLTEESNREQQQLSNIVFQEAHRFLQLFCQCEEQNQVLLASEIEFLLEEIKHAHNEKHAQSANKKRPTLADDENSSSSTASLSAKDQFRYDYAIQTIIQVRNHLFFLSFFLCIYFLLLDRSFQTTSCSVPM